MERFSIEITGMYNLYIFESIDGTSYLCGDSNDSSAWRKMKKQLPDGKWKMGRVNANGADGKKYLELILDIKGMLSDFLQESE